MRVLELRKLLQGAALAASIAAAPVAVPSVLSAQTPDPGVTQTDDMYDDDDDMDWGWVGLLGLAGLLGLRRRDHHVHHTDTTARRPMT